MWSAYERGTQFARGSFGEVWRGVRRRQNRQNPREGSDQGVTAGAAANVLPEDGSGAPEEGFEQGFVLKRILGERGSDAWLSGRREEYFGRLFWPAQARVVTVAGSGGGGAEHVVRFVEALEARPKLYMKLCSSACIPDSGSAVAFVGSSCGADHLFRRWRRVTGADISCPSSSDGCQHFNYGSLPTL